MFTTNKKLKSSLRGAFFLFLSFTTHASIVDTYPNFETLAKHEIQDVDFKISVIDNKSSITLLAIHGGAIEPGTSELTRAIGNNFNQYFFEGIKSGDNSALHLTSSHFDEPQALALVSRSKKCLSLHSYLGSSEGICIGGRNLELAKILATKLKSVKPDIEIYYPCSFLPGMHPNNIVNRCQEAGVQLEFSSTLLDHMRDDKALMNEFAKTIDNELVNAP